MELSKLTAAQNEEIFGKGRTRMSLSEFVDASVSPQKLRSDEKNTVEVVNGAVVTSIPRKVRFNGIELSKEQFRTIAEFEIEELSPQGFRNFLGILSIYVPELFGDKAVFAETGEFAKSELGQKALAYRQKQQLENI